MQDLNYELKQLCARNRDGSYATQANRERILTLIANQLREMGFVNMHVQSLKPKHVEALVQRWQAEGLSAGTLKNRMSDPALVGGEDRQAQRRRQEQRSVWHSRPALRHQRQQSPRAHLRRSRPGHRSVHAHVAPAASNVWAAAQGVHQDSAGVGGSRRHLVAQGQLGQRPSRPRDPDPQRRATPRPG